MMKFGRLPQRPGTKNIFLRDFLYDPAAEDTPDIVLVPPLNWPMDLNDQIGDCCIAGVSHGIQLVTYDADSGHAKIMTDAQVQAVYSAISGYVPGDESTDTGCVETDVLDCWMNTGVDGDNLDAYAAIAPTDLETLKRSIFWFGFAYLGVNLPQSAMDNMEVWDVGGDETILGGHCIIAVGYDAQYVYVISWGKVIQCTPAWIAKFCEEAYACISDEWIESSGMSIHGLNLDQLKTDLQSIKGTS